ncbi:MAG: flavin reductase family protein [Lachnospiraceae bacterium]|jgi:flavin reductase (DIM6/NTAB) family NADH-FMN oxidoreductase RutF|nr:flavin reductase family protein [Lachnospiraceae bacterium]MEE3461590.1 flavin reductase family protein [Lachnospiraceae bacterium]
MPTVNKTDFKPGNMLYPLPAVLVSCGEYDKDDLSKSNFLTIAWTGTICSDPPMVFISVRPSRHSYDMIRKSGEFVINLTTEGLVQQTDKAGVWTGSKVNKWKELRLTPMPAKTVMCPVIAESPVNIECKVQDVKELGSHTMFTALVTNVQVTSDYIDEKNVFHLNDTGLLAYSHGTYFSLGKKLGTFGYSVRKK